MWLLFNIKRGFVSSYIFLMLDICTSLYIKGNKLLKTILKYWKKEGLVHILS